MSKAYRICFISLVLLSTVGCDQVAKKVAKAELASSAPISLLGDLVRLEYAENPGAFLGIGENLPGPLLLVLSSLFAGGLIILLASLGTRKRDAGLGTLLGVCLIAGGSIGNVIDRMLNAGAVVDYISLGTGRLRTGIFNLADISILTGALILLIVMSGKSGKTGAV